MPHWVAGRTIGAERASASRLADFAGNQSGPDSCLHRQLSTDWGGESTSGQVMKITGLILTTLPERLYSCSSQAKCLRNYPNYSF